MALSIFKKTAPTKPVGPAVAALNDKLATANSITAERTKIGSRMEAIHREQQKADGIGAEIQSLREQIDAAQADAAYNRQPEPDFSREQSRLNTLETAHKGASETARRGQAILPRLQDAYTATGTQLDEIRRPLNRLLWEAAIERMAESAAELATAEEIFRAAHRRAFIAAVAADRLAMEEHYGVFYGSALYSQLVITKPIHEALDPNPMGPEAAQRAHNADLAQLDKDADALIQELLLGE